MPLYLAEIWLKDPNPERAKEFASAIAAVAKDPTSVGVPAGVRFVAGPWASNEEAKAIAVVEMPDHSKTFGVFGGNVARGFLEKRRLTPIVEWSEVEKMVQQI